MSSLTPQNANPAFAQTRSQVHVFQAQQPPTNLTAPSPPQPTGFARPTRAPIPRQQHNSPYTTPYAPNGAQAVPRQNGSGVASAEQQIAQGVLSNTQAGQSAPQRRNPPALGTTIHMPLNGTPQSQSMNINHTVTAPSTSNTNHDFGSARQSQNGSPALQNLNAQRQSMNASPAGPNLGARPQEPSPIDNDMSMIDPQLGIGEQLGGTPDNSMLSHGPPADTPVIQGEMLSPPPGGSFPTFEALFASAQSHALAHGYAFVIGRSKRDNRGLKKVFLICDRGGSNKEKVPGEQRQRKTKSRKCGCEFGVFGLEGKTAWILRGRIDGEHLTHNHPPSESPTEHPGARKLDPKAIAAVKALEENGVSVKETLEILHRENPTVRFLPRDIYNARAAIKRDPSRVESTAMENLPTFYKKPPMTFEEKLRAELRTKVAEAEARTAKVEEAWAKDVEHYKELLAQKDKQIQKFEMFIDICNERVMVRREELAEGEGGAIASG